MFLSSQILDITNKQQHHTHNSLCAFITNCPGANPHTSGVKNILILLLHHLRPPKRLTPGLNALEKQ